jgi:hypothetical protein
MTGFIIQSVARKYYVPKTFPVPRFLGKSLTKFIWVCNELALVLLDDVQVSATLLVLHDEDPPDGHSHYAVLDAWPWTYRDLSESR